MSEFAGLATSLERAAGRPLRRLPQPTLADRDQLEDLVQLAPTARLEEQLGSAVMRLFDICPDHLDRGVHPGDMRHRQLVSEIARCEKMLDQARVRDRLAAEAGCRCLGLGGWGAVGLVADAEVTVDADHGFRTFNGGRTVGTACREYCDCPTGQRLRAEHLADAKAIDDAARLARMDRLWDSVPEEFRGVSIDTYPVRCAEQHHTVELLRAWLESTRWLFLYGPVGRGKSSLAVAAAAELHQVGLYVSVPRMLGRLRATYDGDGRESEVLASLYTVPVLVLDDLGKEKRSDWASEKLFLVVDERWSNHRRTIITSNFDIETLTDRLGDPGEAVVSRIRSAARPYLIHVGGPDLRG